MTRPIHPPRVDPRSSVAAFLSFLFPGIGQAFNRQWGLAWLLAVPVLLVIGLALAFVALSSSSVFSRLLDARVLVGLIVLDLALLGWRLVAIDTLGTVALEGGGALFDERAGRDVAIPVPTYQPRLGLGERVTILLVGIDFAPGRENELTDTMLVTTLDPDSGEGAMISIPRDLYGVPLGDGRVFNAKLNGLMTTAEADPAGYPLGGPGTLKAAIGELLGTRIHYVAAIDIEGMRQVVDTIGGVDVVVERAIDDPRYHDTFTGQRGFSIEAGPRHLDGQTAMAFVRSRYGAGDSDFTRAARQQQVLTAIARKLTAGNLLLALPGLLDAVRENLATDIPSDRFAVIAAEVEDANLAGLERVVLTPDDGFVVVEQNEVAGYILHPDFEAIRAMADRIFRPSTVRGLPQP